MAGSGCYSTDSVESVNCFDLTIFYLESLLWCLMCNCWSFLPHAACPYEVVMLEYCPGISKQSSNLPSEARSWNRISESMSYEQYKIFVYTCRFVPHIYRKVGSSKLSWLVAHLRIFRLFMKGKFDAYVLWTLAKRVQNGIVDRFTAHNFGVSILAIISFRLHI